MCGKGCSFPGSANYMHRSEQVSKFGSLVVCSQQWVVICGARNMYLVVMKTDSYPVVQAHIGMRKFCKYKCSLLFCRGTYLWRHILGMLYLV